MEIKINNEQKVESQWSILKLIEWSTNYLIQKGIDEARLNTELMLGHVLNLKRIELYLHYDMILSETELSHFKNLFKKRLTKEPLQYILGYTEFMGIRINVTPAVLIPRPETEILVEAIIKKLKSSKKSNNKIFEIGTGSGCIAVSLAKYLPDISITAIDKSTSALEVAKQNASDSNVNNKIKFIESDFLSQNYDSPGGLYDVIVSNPPYIHQDEIDSLEAEVKNFEPENAYTDHSDGLTFYKAISLNGKNMLINGGLIFVEVGYNQGQTVKNIFQSDGYRNIKLINDYNGIGRVVIAEKE
ncbi:MAG: peptide chain release factor N(5)-glutamine methyltransferase [Ignavibacteriales bacterium]|nr:peptide chain release factor N(5)-glutamine methyltransferase [Ignavibacteriales bacterium]